MIIIHTPEEIEKIAAASRLTAETLSMLEKAVKPGMREGIRRLSRIHLRIGQ